MKLLVVILKNERLFDRISSILLEVGLFDSSVLDGENIESLKDTAMPLFSSFKSLFGKDYSYNRTIIGPVYDNEAIFQFVKICEKEGIDFSNPETGCLFSLPCSIYTGDNGEDL